MPRTSPRNLVLLATCLAALLGLFAAPASATYTVVQQREAGPKLLAHRYEVPGLTGKQQLKLVVRPDVDWTTITTLDFDRDGEPEGLVNAYWSAGTQNVVWQLWKLDKGVMAPSLGDNGRCFAPWPGRNAANQSIDPGGHGVALVKRASSWTVTIDASFHEVYGDNARLQPVMTTMYTTAARALANTHPVQDYLPDSAAPAAADTTCMGLVGGQYVAGMRLQPAGGTDRGQQTPAATRRQTMLERNEAPRDPDLLEASIDQWDAKLPTADVTADAPAATLGTFHPADLVLRFRQGTTPASATYLFRHNDEHPSGFVTTSAVSGGRIQATLHVGLTSKLSGDRCYPRDGMMRLADGSLWGTEPIDVELATTTDADGNLVARIPLDRLLRIYEGGFGDTSTFRWVATTLPAGFGDPDYVPDLAAVTPTGYCTFTGDGGATSNGTAIYPSRAVRMGTAVPDVTLTPSNPSPPRGAAITLTAASATATGFRFDATGSGVFDAFTAGATRSASFSSAGAATPRVYVVDNGGVGTMASTRITPENPPPVASTIVSAPAPYVLSASGPTVTWTDTSTDTGGIAKRAWKLSSSRLAQPRTGSGASFSHTFVPGEHGDWELELTVTDDEGATATTKRAFRVVQPPVAIIDRVTPHGTDEDGPVIWDQYAGGQFRAHPRTAADGSLGSEGPLLWHWNWEPEWPESKFWMWNVPYAQAHFSFPGSYPIQLKVEDADGRMSAPSPYFYVNVRAPGETPPTAKVTVGPGSPVSGTDVLVDASASVLNNPDGSTEKAWSFRYDFGDGSEPLVTTQDAVTHRYAGSGRYTVSVVAYDTRFWANNSASPPATAEVVVGQGTTDANAPVAKLERTSAGDVVFAKRDVVLSAAGSTVRTAPARYAWDLDGDGGFETDGGTEATLTTAFPTAGRREVRVRVTDGFGRVAVSDALALDVDAAPELEPHVALAGPDVVTMGGGAAVADLDASASRGRNRDPSLTFRWDLDGDGIYEHDSGAGTKASARFTVGGDQTVRVMAVDVYGNRAIAAKTIFVRTAADAAAGCEGREQYRTVTFGPARAAACWVRVDRPSAGALWIARGDVALNGLPLTRGTRGSAPNRTFADCAGACATAQATFNDEGRGMRVVLDPSSGRLQSNMAVKLLAKGSDVEFALHDGPLDLVLPATTSADGFLLRPPGGARLLTLRVADEAEVRFPSAGTATIGLSVHMPPQMPGASADVKLRSTESQGIVLDDLKVEITSGLLADYLKLGGLKLEYRRADRYWLGGAELELPAIAGKSFGVLVEVGVQNDAFKSIYGEVDGLNVHLGKGIYLQRLRAGVGVNPLDLQGGLGISAGPKILGTQLLSADGDLRVTFPSPSAPYTLFQIAGGTKLLDTFDLSRGVLRFATNGFVEARGGMTRTAAIGYFEASLGGWVWNTKAQLSGEAEVGLLFMGDKVKLAGGKAVLSTRGVAACGEIPVIKVGGGVGHRWGESFDVFTGCDLGPYSEARPAGIPDGFGVRAVTAADKAPTVKLAKGLRSAGVTVHGRGGAPRVKLVDRDGRTVVDATAERLDAEAMVLFDEDNDLTQILWKRPPAGDYVVLPAEGSHPIAKVQQAVDAGPQRVNAKLVGKGAARRLEWAVTPKLQRGQELLLAEQLPKGGALAGPAGGAAQGGAGSVLAATKKSQGSVPFRPTPGHGEQREIAASIVTDGLGRPAQVVARFAAPEHLRAPKPATVALVRKGRTVTATWAPPRGAKAPAGGWRVSLVAGSGRRVQDVVGAKKRTYALREVPAEMAVRVEVAGLDAQGMAGPVRKAVLAAGATRSGAGGAAAARPRALEVRRSGRKLVVRWKAGAEAARAYAVTVKVGRRTTRLQAHPRKPTVSVAGLPKGRAPVTVEVRAERFAGGRSPAAKVRRTL